MNIYGILLLSLLGVILAVLIARLILDLIWNKRLNAYKQANNIKTPTKTMNVGVYRRLLMMMLTSCLLVVVVASGLFNLPHQEIFYGRTLVSARTAKDSTDIRSKIEAGNGWSLWQFYSPGDDAIPEAAPEDNAESTPRNYVGTNLQEYGVDEGDIIKSDGNIIYYVSQYQLSRINKVYIHDDGSIKMLEPITIPKFITQSMYLTDDKLILIGYKIEQIPYTPNYEGYDYMILPSNWWYKKYTSTVKVFDRNTDTEVFEFVTNGQIYEHRIIDNHLYLINQQEVNPDIEDLRPTFTVTEDGTTIESYVDYNDIIYFDHIPVTNYVVITTINLDDYTFNAQAILGTYHTIYVSLDSIYLVGTYYKYTLFTTIHGTQLVKYALDREHSKVMYVGQAEIEGNVLSQFWLDEYEGMIRLVTTFTNWNKPINRLYIFKESEVDDNLELIGLLDEGIGKPNESVKSVRFDEDVVYIVTFLETDPLYTISLSEPSNPLIINFIEESGYNTYLHPFGENHLIGIGYNEYFSLKISAYETENIQEPLQTYTVGIDDEFDYDYAWGEALHNHKAILISADYGFVAFAASGYGYVEIDQYSWSYKFYSAYFIFKIDFENDQVISDPIIVSHGTSDYQATIERGIYINGIIYSFNYDKVVATSIDTGEKVDEALFPVSDDNFYHIWY
ncbi:MAG TPA: beta-propeller domain-containing protein [Acholeplasma sp.]